MPGYESDALLPGWHLPRVLPSSRGRSRYSRPVDLLPVWWGGRPQTPLPGGGSPPLALTFDMETREDTVQFRRRTSVSGITGRPVANRPPPRKTVVILVWGAISESPTGSLRKFIVPGQGLPLGISPGTAPAPSGGGGGAPRAGRGGGYEEGSTSSVACGEGASPLAGPHPPGRCPPRSTARVRGDTPRSPEPTWGFNRA